MKNQVVKRLSIGTKKFLEIITSGFAIGVSASLYGFILSEVLSKNIITLLFLATALLLIALIVLSRSIFASSRASILVEGFIVVRNADNKLISVPRYDFTESMSNYLNSAFVEKSALKTQWDSEPLDNIMEVDEAGRSNAEKVQSWASALLVREAAEYYAIESLSMHLSSYFASSNFKDEELVILTRNDVPSILMENRFMALFSESMKDRSSFSSEFVNDDNFGRVVLSQGLGGTRYSRFGLTVPKDAKVSREDGKIVLDTPKFVLSLTIKFDGYNTNTPRDFEDYYLGYDSIVDLSVYGISFEASVHFKLLASLYHSNWNYYEWLDSFFASMEEKMGSETFYERISWNTAATMIHCNKISTTENEISHEREHDMN